MWAAIITSAVLLISQVLARRDVRRTQEDADKVRTEERALEQHRREADQQAELERIKLEQEAAAAETARREAAALASERRQVVAEFIGAAEGALAGFRYLFANGGDSAAVSPSDWAALKGNLGRILLLFDETDGDYARTVVQQLGEAMSCRASQAEPRVDQAKEALDKFIDAARF